MNTTNIVRTQIAVAILSFASLVVFAAAAPGSVDEMQSFVGTAPNVAMVEAQAPTF